MQYKNQRVKSQVILLICMAVFSTTPHTEESKQTKTNITQHTGMSRFPGVLEMKKIMEFGICFEYFQEFLVFFSKYFPNFFENVN